MLDGMLSPAYIKSLPQKDGWGDLFGFGTTSNGVYGIRSAGKDNSFQSAIVVGGTQAFDCDIVYSNGSFIQFPEGIQAQ